MTFISLCFFERKPSTNKINQAENLIREYISKKINYAESYNKIDEPYLTSIIFKNPSSEFIKDLKDFCDIDLKPCLEG